MKTIAIMNLKGGCGKTTTSVNMAQILQEKYNKRVLLIDNDKQGNLSKTFGVWGYEEASIEDVLIKDMEIREVKQKINNYIDVIPANMHLLSANLEIIKNEEIEQATILKNKLDKEQSNYDYCIIDCPPDINISVINALATANEVIIPIKIDGYTFDGMEELEKQIENVKQINKKIKLKGCLITMYYKSQVNQQGEEWLKDQKYPVFSTHIRRTEKADESTFTSSTLMQYSPRSAAAVDYRKFVKEYLEV